MKCPAARLLQPPQKKQMPLTRAEAERKLSEVLGQGNEDLFAKYVRKRTHQLSISELRHLASSFTQGDQFDFEVTFERQFGNRAYVRSGRTEPRLYGDDLELVKFD